VDIAIVGAGIMGLVTAWALVRAGHRVQVFDQGPIPNPVSSSHDDHRVIRQAYGAMSGYAALVDDAYRAWDALWRDLGRRHLVETGMLVLAAPGEGWAQESADDMTRRGVPFRWIDAEEQERLVPMLVPRRHGRAFHTPTGGVLLASRIVADLARYLAGRGVALHEGHAAVAIDRRRPAVELADGRSIGADLIVAAAGAWLPKLMPDVAGRLVPSRQIVVYLAPPPARAASWSAAPIIADLDGGNGFYLLPCVAGTGLKLGDHRFSGGGAPDDDRTAAPAEIEALMANCRARLVGATDYNVVGSKVCYYALAEAERFDVRPLAQDRVWVVNACSGHGFKFAAWLGLGIADVLAGRRDHSDFTRRAAGAPGFTSQQSQPIFSR